MTPTSIDSMKEIDPSEARYLLVVNAANKDKDWEWLSDQKKRFKNLLFEDKSEELGMIALQGPLAKGILEKILIEGHTTLPDPWRNRLRVSEVEGERVSLTISRTGYTGEPICFELFVRSEKARMVWEKILAIGEKEGVVPWGWERETPCGWRPDFPSTVMNWDSIVKGKRFRSMPSLLPGRQSVSLP